MSEAPAEKKVEYLELIYDLIFVYVIGRNNSLLQHLENGFVSGQIFLAYVLCTLAVIQIWNYSTFYINVYGRNGVRDHVFLCVNMFLLYFIADATGAHWQESFYQYSTAWALILLNLALQHFIEIRNHPDAPQEVAQLRRKGLIILVEAALVGLHMVFFHRTGVSLAALPILFGVAAMVLSSRRGALACVDFAHLSERAMLYVVFTFGEMIIAVSGYFGEGFTVNNVYFAAMAFLIVVGLFLGYGTFYNKILDREIRTSGVEYMAIHILLIFALNNITTSLEFMREESVSLLPKTVFLTTSFVLYYLCLFLTGAYAKKRCRLNRPFLLLLLAVGAAFVALMLLLRQQMYLNIALTVLFVFGVYGLIRNRAGDMVRPA